VGWPLLSHAAQETSESSAALYFVGNPLSRRDAAAVCTVGRGQRHLLAKSGLDVGGIGGDDGSGGESLKCIRLHVRTANLEHLFAPYERRADSDDGAGGDPWD